MLHWSWVNISYCCVDEIYCRFTINRLSCQTTGWLFLDIFCMQCVLKLKKKIRRQKFKDSFLYLLTLKHICSVCYCWLASNAVAYLGSGGLNGRLWGCLFWRGYFDVPEWLQAPLGHIIKFSTLPFSFSFIPTPDSHACFIGCNWGRFLSVGR